MKVKQPEKRKYERPGRSYQAQRRCRLALRHGGEILVILFTDEIAKQAGIEIGKRVGLYFDQTEFTITPEENGAFAIRKQKSGNIIYPHMLVRVGVDQPFQCKFDSHGPHTCEHKVDKSGLTLRLPKGVRLTLNDEKEKGLAVVA